MILDADTFNATSPGSKTIILCRCDGCGKERGVLKKDLTRTGDRPCLACSRRLYPGHAGKPHSADAKRKLVAARARQTMPKWSATRRAKMSGDRAPNWNPNRQEVVKNEAARKISYGLLWRVLLLSGNTKTARCEVELGYTRAELATHIESLFKPGMSWDNRADWHIDHIRPVCAFAKEGVTDPKVINALSNLRPLWAAENLARRFTWMNEVAA